MSPDPKSDFAVFVLAGDEALFANESRWFPSPNVIFELGFLAGRLGLSRTFVVVADAKRITLPTDLTGTMFIGLSTADSNNLSDATAPVAAVIRKAIANIQITQDRSLEYYSCFISYSSNDMDFATRVHDDLQNVGVRCWLDAKDMKVGDKLFDQIDKAIQAHDKVLLILSQASIRSEWIRHEVQNALRLERDRHKTTLFPLRLDDTIFEASGIQEIDALRSRHIADFRRWRDKSFYNRAFSRLVRDLAISASVESGGRS